jgi:hypothetical protein
MTCAPFIHRSRAGSAPPARSCPRARRCRQWEAAMTEYETYGGSPSACWRAGGSGFADHRVLVAEAAPAFSPTARSVRAVAPGAAGHPLADRPSGAGSFSRGPEGRRRRPPAAGAGRRLSGLRTNSAPIGPRTARPRPDRHVTVRPTAGRAS